MVDDPQTVSLDSADKEAIELADECDKQYSLIIDALHKGFNGDMNELGSAWLTMIGFAGTIGDLLKVELKHGPHAGLHAGPRFKYVPS